ncbi:MAG: LCP family protein [Acidimicrobiia bacterium]|nr:LCP family protein [Acidimicrobiia bacterium]
MRTTRGGTARSWVQRLIIATGMLLAVMMFAGAALTAFFWSRLNRFDKIEVTLERPDAGEPVNYLLVGSDSRDNIDQNSPNAGAFLGDQEFSGHRSDTIMLARVDPEAATISLLSIPRDLYVPIAGSDTVDRVNSAYNEGPQVLVDTIVQYLGVPVNHYVEVDFNGFKGLVDVLDGVPIYFDRPMRDEQTGLDIGEVGCWNLNGDQALAFARSRSLEVYDDDVGFWRTDPTADLGRISRQQLFLRKAMDKAAQLGLGDVGKLNSLVNVATDNVSFDAGLSITESVGLARQFVERGGDGIRPYALPVEPMTSPEGAAVLRLLESDAEPTLDVFRGVTAVIAEPLRPDQVSLQVLNGTGISGQAGEAASRLETHGFTVTSVGDAPNPRSTTAIEYPPGEREAAELVAGTLRGEATLTERSDAVALTLVTGADFVAVRLPEAIEVAATQQSATSDGAGAEAAPTTTTAEVIGFVPGDPPDGEACTG